MTCQAWHVACIAQGMSERMAYGVMVLGAVLWVLLVVLYDLWEARCPVCKSLATRKLTDDSMRCSNCGHTFDF
jgi:hypothetical protein